MCTMQLINFTLVIVSSTYSFHSLYKWLGSSHIFKDESDLFFWFSNIPSV